MDKINTSEQGNSIKFALPAPRALREAKIFLSPASQAAGSAGKEKIHIRGAMGNGL